MRRWLIAIALAVTAVAACNIQPQPLPPGAQPGASDAGTRAPTEGAGSDTAGKPAADAGTSPPATPSDGAADAGVEISDGSFPDAGSDAPADAGSDAPADAGSDATGAFPDSG